MKTYFLQRNKTLGCWSFDLMPGRGFCPAWDSEPNSTCRFCYAQQYRGNTGLVKNARMKRTQRWMNLSPEKKAETMVREIGCKRYIRLFSSGDFLSLKDIQTWSVITKLLPETRFWVSARSWLCGRAWVNALAKLDSSPNVCVRLSAHSIDKFGDLMRIPRFCRSVVSKSGKGCPKQVSGLSCVKSGCFACWDSSVFTITYRLHGYRLKEKSL